MSFWIESLLLWLAFAAGWFAIAATASKREPNTGPMRFTWWALVLWLAVAIPSLLQLAVPQLLELGMRNDAIVHQGQWWRILTANVFQDGGLAGTLSNLSVLAVTLLLVGRVLPGALAVLLYIVGGVGSMLLQLEHPGAGNSMATLALLAATSVLELSRSRPSRLGVVILIGIGTILTVLDNQHGPAILIGVLMGVIMSPVLSGFSIVLRSTRLCSRDLAPRRANRRPQSCGRVPVLSVPRRRPPVRNPRRRP